MVAIVEVEEVVDAVGVVGEKKWKNETKFMWICGSRVTVSVKHNSRKYIGPLLGLWNWVQFF